MYCRDPGNTHLHDSPEAKRHNKFSAWADFMMAITKRKISDYKQDPANANKGTERGVYMLEHSLEEFGAGRSLVADRNGVLIAGNKTQERAADLGITDVIEIETDGTQLVVVKRTDLDLEADDKRARGLAYADNRAGEVGLEWDAEQLLSDLHDGIDIGQFFHQDEIEEVIGAELDRVAKLEETMVTLKPMSRMYALVSFSVDDAIEAKDLFDSLDDRFEVAYASN